MALSTTHRSRFPHFSGASSRHVASDFLDASLHRKGILFICVVEFPKQELIVLVSEVILDTDDRRTRPSHIWCGRFEVARRLAEKVMRAKHEYDHSKRTLTGQDDTG